MRHALCILRQTGAKTRSGYANAALTLYENANVPTAEVDVVGKLTPVHARIVPLERTEEKQCAVEDFDAFWHLTVQPGTKKQREYSDQHVR